MKKKNQQFNLQNKMIMTNVSFYLGFCITVYFKNHPIRVNFKFTTLDNTWKDRLIKCESNMKLRKNYKFFE